MLTNIRIILVGTSHPGNIGAAARAMKNMGLSRLYLVSPKVFPHVDATARASGADDILANAVVTDSLAEALSNCKLVIGTSARLRDLPMPLFSPREAAAKAIAEAQQHELAIVFGRESSGLTNEELYCCHYQINIPTNAEYSSLNLGAAVQVVVYELYLASLAKPQQNDQFNAELASADEMELFFNHLQQTLFAIKFLKPTHSRKLMLRLRLLFNRARVDKNELNILRGILTAMTNHRL
jgi:tRNA (cytidine32/uridine32-2'-O)-methyltransferase